MLFLAVLVRAPLMVAGFFCALILSGIIGKVVAASFLVFESGMNAGHSGPITVIPMLFIFGSTCVVVTHKVFKLITHLPDTVTKWVGQQVQNLGEDQDEQRVRSATSSAVTTMASAGSTGMSGGGLRSPGGGGVKVSDGNSRGRRSAAESQHDLGETPGKFPDNI